MPYGDFTKHITGDKLPYVVTGLKAGSTGVASPNAALHTMEIWIEHVVSAMGVDEEDAWKDCINLCGQIEKAINGLGKDLAWIRDAIQAVDPTAVLMGDLVFKTAGYTPRAFDNGFQACVGQSVLTIPLKLDTCRKAEEYAPVA